VHDRLGGVGGELARRTGRAGQRADAPRDRALGVLAAALARANGAVAESARVE
jgi:hypothetical protein